MCYTLAMRYRLTDEQMSEAIAEGYSRHNGNPLRVPRFGARFETKNQNLIKDINGAMAELAVSVVTGQQWSGREHSGPGSYKKPDVGTDIQVRSTVYPQGHLLVYEDALDLHWYVLVICEYPEPEVRICGAILAQEAKRKEWLNDIGKGQSYWVPQSALDIPS